jgi:hypothetical protein
MQTTTADEQRSVKLIAEVELKNYNTDCIPSAMLTQNRLLAACPYTFFIFQTVNVTAKDKMATKMPTTRIIES